MTITCNSYFSGAGLFDIGLLNAGLDIQASYEIDPVACKVQRNNGHLVTESDLTQKLVEDGPISDVHVYTYPCTKYSTIADIHGTRTGEDLFLHAFRHMAIARPEVFVIENVPGMRKFKVVMEAMTRLPDYYTTTFCPIKSETWLPQRRDRLIIIGSKKPFNWRQPINMQPVKLAEILESDPDIKIPKSVASRLSGKYRDLPIISDPDKGDIAPCCVAHYAKDRSTRLVVDKRFPNGVRPYTVREYARLQGVPDSFEFDCTNNEAYKMIGNGVSVPLGEWVGGELTRYFARNNNQFITTKEAA
jgi:DNA (cytosine-5)-methyltransferase 1